MTTLYTEAINTLAHQPIITIACGTTCAYLGDERNLREFLVADETAQQLRKAGSTVISLLIDDSMDPLSFRQLRVAVNKDPLLIDRFKDWCGKPISLIPDPWGCCESFAAHFENELLQRLHALDCHPTLISTAKLYNRGVYAPYVRKVLQHSDAILTFLRDRFKRYEPEKLFWPLCPACEYIDETTILGVDQQYVHIDCNRCDYTAYVGLDEVKGKLNWKLDCAARWAIFNINAEPFTKAYLEPQTGSFAVAQALSQEFFSGPQVMPLHYGLMKMENALGLKLLESLPVPILRSMLTESPTADLTLSHDLVITVASRYEALPGLTYLDFVKQVLPTWLLTPHTLTPQQRALVSHGIAFKKHFLGTEAQLHLPTRDVIEGEQPDILSSVYSLLCQIIELREQTDGCWEVFQPLATHALNTLGKHKGATLRRLRLLVGQQQGIPATRFLFILPLEYLRMLAYIVELHLHVTVAAFDDLLVA